MPRSTDARENALETAERLFRIQGYAATGLNQILEESTAPKGSFYHHFPGGKAQMAEEALAAYAAKGDALIAHIAARSGADAAAFVTALAGAFAAEMERSGWTLGCMAQNFAGELAPGDARWTARLAEVFGGWSRAIAAALRAGGVEKKRATALAVSLLAALEGARTLARVQQSRAPFDRVAESFRLLARVD
jgi:TetR/AcrR family transcriptional regulator, lmrAB and yxaGH operons repressor